MPVFKSNSCVFALLWLYILKIEEDAPVFPPSSCSGHLWRCPQVCRGLGIWRCWDPVFWPCLQEPRLSTCTTYRIWWVINQQLFSLCWSYLWWLRLFSRLICLNSSSLFFRLINVKYSLNYVNRKKRLCYLSEYSRCPTKTRRAANWTTGTQTARGSCSAARTAEGGLKSRWRHKSPMTSRSPTANCCFL